MFVDGLVIDNFAGGGGASIGIERALGRPIDIAINHDPAAIAMHSANHPQTEHFCENIWQVDPADIRARGKISVAWFSPDCKHHSKAKGGKPRDRAIRGLAWIVVLWAQRAAPDIIFLENVEEFQDWGPLDQDDKPIKDLAGSTFQKWIREIRKCGYQVDWRQLKACDYGAPTIRKRLYVIARRDGQPIRWPEPSHGIGLTPYRSAAECLNFNLPCPSIFTRKRPLVEATMERIAKGTMRYVINAERPFIIPNGARDDRDDHTDAVAAFMAQHNTGSVARPLDEPMTTATERSTQQQLVEISAVHIEQANTGMVGHDIRKPLSTIVGKGCTQRLVTSHLCKLRNNGVGQPVDAPIHTITSGGTHFGEVRAFLAKYYGEGGQWQDLRSPMHTVPTRDRFALVTVHGEIYAIKDIGMRMLTPPELAAAQGCPDDYRLDPMFEGKPLNKTAQTAKIGNMVCPDVAEAIVSANCQPQSIERKAA